MFYSFSNSFRYKLVLETKDVTVSTITQTLFKVQLFKSSNRDKSKKLDSILKEARSQATAMELEFASIAYYAQGRQAKAIEYLDKCLKKYGADLNTGNGTKIVYFYLTRVIVLGNL